MIRRPRSTPPFPTTTLFRPHRPQQPLAGVRPPEVVALALELQVLHRPVLLAQREDELVRLADRHVGVVLAVDDQQRDVDDGDRKSTRLNSSHANISYAVFCL